MDAASGKSVKVVPEVLQGVKSAKCFLSKVTVMHSNEPSGKSPSHRTFLLLNVAGIKRIQHDSYGNG